MGVNAVAVALCMACGRPIEDWRERFTPVNEGELVVVDETSAMLALRVCAPGACPCGGDEIEIRVLDTH